MSAFLSQAGHSAQNGYIICLGPSRGEVDLPGIGAQSLGRPLPGLIELLSDLAAKPVNAGRVAKLILKIRNHRFKYFRPHRCGGGMIEIYSAQMAHSSDAFEIRFASVVSSKTALMASFSLSHTTLVEQLPLCWHFSCRCPSAT